MKIMDHRMFPVVIFCLMVLFLFVGAGWGGYLKQQADDEWYRNAKEAGCKRTGYFNQHGYSTPRGLWTCPDGQAYLEPR